MDVAPVFKPGRSKYLVFTADYILPALICVTVAGLAYLTLYSPVFRVATITCSLDYVECQDPSVLAELEALQGKNIFKLDENSVKSRLTSGDFTIREVVVTRELPNSVHLDLQSVYPVVALQAKGDTTWVVMDEHLRVIATRTTDPNVPTVVIETPLTVTVGKPPSEESVKQTLEFAIQLGRDLSSVKTIILIDSDTLELTFTTGPRAIMTPQKALGPQLSALQAVLSDATITKGVRVVDVRFSQPVLR